jgi:hypothetical protein
VAVYPWPLVGGGVCIFVGLSGVGAVPGGGGGGPAL